jgi:Flp pilus assembly protein TadG
MVREEAVMVPKRNDEGASDRGQAAILVVLVATALVALVMSAMATFGLRLHDRTRAQSVADAAALASLDGGRSAATAVAAANGATIESWATGPGPQEITVVVRIGAETGTARASDSPGAPASGAGTGLTGP